MLRQVELFPSKGDWREASGLVSPLVHWFRVTLSKGPRTLGAYILSPEDGKRFGFENVIFSSYSEFLTITEVHEAILLNDFKLT
jgi:hypothetical protein